MFYSNAARKQVTKNQTKNECGQSVDVGFMNLASKPLSKKEISKISKFDEETMSEKLATWGIAIGSNNLDE